MSRIERVLKKRRSSLGKLGVRVQTSNISDPTSREAIDNIMITQAIKSGELSAIISDLDADLISLHESEVRTIRNMKEDYSILQSTFFYIPSSNIVALPGHLILRRIIYFLAKQRRIHGRRKQCGC